MRVMLMVVFLVLHAAAAGAGCKTVTLYLDGARIEHELSAVQGYLEVPLSAGMQPNSLRIRPVDGSEIVRVEVSPPRSQGRPHPEQSRLADRRERLAARLKALDTREEIFKAAAKAQSGKAPRKTKTNPEPMANIRRGTDYALSQLEEVYRVRQRTEQELRDVETRLAAAARESDAGKSLARVWLKGKRGRVRLSYLRGDLSWRPRYDLRLNGDGQLEIVQHAAFPPAEVGVETFVVAASLASPSTDGGRHAVGGGSAPVAAYRFPADHPDFAPFPQSSVAFSFKNSSSEPPPAGEAACYRQGEFLGTFRFPGISPGETREVVCGR